MGGDPTEQVCENPDTIEYIYVEHPVEMEVEIEENGDITITGTICVGYGITIIF
ncbi:MAG: hypothetical protein AAFW73_13085 [Bacteroidota bacterium]